MAENLTIFFYVMYFKEIHLEEETFNSINLTVRKHYYKPDLASPSSCVKPYANDVNFLSCSSLFSMMKLKLTGLS